MPEGSGGFLVIKQALARDAAHDLRRSRPLCAAVLVADSRHYFTGDGARKDKDGYFWVMGRVDDVINVSGHRLSTMEVESALVAHEAVAEAAVVGRPDDIKGQAISAFVTLEARKEPTPELKEELRSGSLKKSDRWPSPTISALPTRCPKPAAEKSCAAYCVN